MSSALSVLVALLLILPIVFCTPADLTFNDCFSSANVSGKLTVSNVYAQVLHNATLSNYLDLVVIGETPVEIIGRSNSSLNLGAHIFFHPQKRALTLGRCSHPLYIDFHSDFECMVKQLVLVHEYSPSRLGTLRCK